LNRAGIESLLPANFRRAVQPRSPLAALLDVMEALHAPSEEVLAGLDRYFDSRRTPDRFVPSLARWLDQGPLLDRVGDELGAGEFPSGNGRLREVVALAAWFSRWRGTRRGMIAYLEVGTGVRGFDVEEHAGGRAFHLRFTAPAEAEPYRTLVEAIIEQEKPACTTYELAFQGRRLAPPDPPADEGGRSGGR
jgi:phage tail-like protein